MSKENNLVPDSFKSNNQLLINLKKLNQQANGSKQIVPGYVYRTDSMPSNKIDQIAAAFKKNNFDLYSRFLSVTDLTPTIYQTLKDLPEDMPNWLPQLIQANRVAGDPFKIPATQTWQLPIELAQFIRIEYKDVDRKYADWFNQLVFKKFHLQMGKEYFIKTGVFSDKFTFVNCHCKEPDQMGDYFIAINNFAAMVGAAHSTTLVVREYIPDEMNYPTIYSGMPIRTEYRTFYDFDQHHLIGVVPYWHPSVMTEALKNDFIKPNDLNNYEKAKPVMMKHYNEYLAEVIKKVKLLGAKCQLKGKWSLDIMENDHQDKAPDFYAIDMARMNRSALTEFI